MNLILWIVQGLLAFVFIAVGSLKLFAYEKFKAQSEKKGPVGITRGLAAFIGFAEIVGGLGIVLPMAANIAPSLSLWAAVGLSTIMLLAIGYHLRRHESAVAPGILLLLAVFVLFGRFSHWT
jgi:putative oxidoreductase